MKASQRQELTHAVEATMIGAQLYVPTNARMLGRF